MAAMLNNYVLVIDFNFKMEGMRKLFSNASCNPLNFGTL